MTDETLIIAAEDVASADLDGETVLLEINSGRYYSLNNVGARILAWMHNPVSIRDLKRALLGLYPVEPERLEADLQTFLQELAEHHLIRMQRC